MKEGDIGTNEPILLNAVQARRQQASTIDVPLIGSRFWTGTTKYSIGLELWEIDSEKVSAKLGSQEYSYGGIKTLLRGLTGSATSAALTPHETALTSFLQPLLMAVVKHFEKPDSILRVKFFAGTANDPGQPALLPLVPGRYVIEYPARPGNRSLASNLLLNSDYTVAPNQQLPSGNRLPNYVVVRVDVSQGNPQVYRSDLIAFRDRIRTQSEVLLPSALRNIVQGQTPTDLLIGQLELNDLKKRYEIRLARETANPINALQWFVDEVEVNRRNSGNAGTPIFSSHQLRDAVGFVSDRMRIAPTLDTDDPTKVFEAWRELIRSASVTGGMPVRTFVKDNTNVFDVSSGFDAWHYDRLTSRIRAIRNANPSNEIAFVSQSKAELRAFLQTVEETDPRRRLTSSERQGVLTKFRELFVDEPGALGSPSVDGSDQARARALSEWIRAPQLSFEVLSNNQDTLRLRAVNWVPSIISKANRALEELHRDNPNNSNPLPALYNQVLAPVINALESTDPAFVSAENKQILANWLAQHSVENFGTDAQRWRTYYNDGQLYVYKISGDITIVRESPFRNALLAINRLVEDLLGRFRQDPNFEMRASVLRPRLAPIRDLLRSFTGQPERKLLNGFAPIATFTSKTQFSELVDARVGSTYFVTFKNGQLYSSQEEFFDPADIVDKLGQFASLTDNEREKQLWRAIRYLTSQNANEASKAEILGLLTGVQGVTDFVPTTQEASFNLEDWQRWYFEQRVTWNATARRYVRTIVPLVT